MKRTLQQILGGLLVCALLLAAAFPAGFMPNSARAAAPDGALYPLVLCTAYGEKTLYVPAAQSPESAAPQDVPPAHDDAAQNHCPYAPVLAQDLPAPALPAAPFVYSAAHTALPQDAAPAASVTRKNWQAQAPPFS